MTAPAPISGLLLQPGGVHARVTLETTTPIATFLRPHNPDTRGRVIEFFTSEDTITDAWCLYIDREGICLDFDQLATHVYPLPDNECWSIFLCMLGYRMPSLHGTALLLGSDAHTAGGVLPQTHRSLPEDLFALATQFAAHYAQGNKGAAVALVLLYTKTGKVYTTLEAINEAIEDM